MNNEIKKVIVGAISGFVSAFLVDCNAWLKSGDDTKFDYEHEYHPSDT